MWFAYSLGTEIKSLLVMSTIVGFEDQEKSNTHALKSFMHDLLVV